MAARLSAERRRQARAFIESQARPLDLALWRQFSGEGSGAEVLEALAPFQNADGGFGHGLEPDLATPASTAIATSVGLRTLRRAEAPADHPMVVRSLAWLAPAFDPAAGVWPIINPAVDEAPHAPWWSYSADLSANWEGFRFNPTAEILAALYVYRASAPAGLVEAAEARMMQSIAEARSIEGAYDLKCGVVLAETPQAPSDLRARLTQLLIYSVAGHDAGDEHAPALELAPTPRSLLADALADRLEQAAATLIGGQQDDGGWTPFWDWGFVDAAAWERAKRDWRGALTRQALEVLQAHGRIEAG